MIWLTAISGLNWASFTLTLPLGGGPALPTRKFSSSEHLNFYETSTPTSILPNTTDMSIEEQIEHDGDEYWFTETITLIAEQDPVTKEWIYFDEEN